MHIIRKWALISILLLAFFVFSRELFAQNISELQNRIQEKSSEILKLEQEIKQFTEELNKTSSEKKNLQGTINELNSTKKKLEKDIDLTKLKINSEETKIHIFSNEIADLEDSIEKHKDAISKSVKIINEKDTDNYLAVLLSNESVSDMWDDYFTLTQTQNEFYENIKKIEKNKEEIEDRQNLSVESKKKLENLKTDLGQQKNVVLTVTKEKDTLLKQTKNKESAYQKMIADRIAQKKAFETDLQSLESSLKFALNPSLIPKGAGALSWPVDSVYITQRFGGGGGVNKKLYANGWHNGTDFKALTGTKIKAMANGVVMGVGDTDQTCRGASFGKFVFIKYNNGLSSTFGHMSSITVSEGQAVIAGDIVGYSGNTGYSTGPHLHVSVYASDGVSMKEVAAKSCGGRIYRMPIAATDAYLDPMKYLPKL